MGGNIVFHKRFDAIFPRFLELDGLDTLQNIYAKGRESDLKNRARLVSKTGRA